MTAWEPPRNRRTGQLVPPWCLCNATFRQQAEDYREIWPKLSEDEKVYLLKFLYSFYFFGDGLAPRKKFKRKNRQRRRATLGGQRRYAAERDALAPCNAHNRGRMPDEVAALSQPSGSSGNKAR
jgi:hypothetical protein